MTDPEFALIVKTLRQAYPAARHSTETLELYRARWRDLDGPTAIRCVGELLDTRRTWPAISDLVQAVRAHEEREAAQERARAQAREAQERAEGYRHRKDLASQGDVRAMVQELGSRLGWGAGG